MALDTQPRAAVAKAQWLASFVEAIRRGSQLFMSEQSVRSMALKQWEAHQGSNPADVARRLNNAVARPR